MVGIAAANTIEIVLHKNMDMMPTLPYYTIGGPPSRTKALIIRRLLRKVSTYSLILASIVDVRPETCLIHSVKYLSIRGNPGIFLIDAAVLESSSVSAADCSAALPLLSEHSKTVLTENRKRKPANAVVI